VHPEVVYARAVAHWRRCPRCRQAGAERAQRSELCRVGQSLLDTWEEAELTCAQLRMAQVRQRPDAQAR